MAVRCLPAILALLTAAVSPALAETYKWVDARGVVNYSDERPPAQAAGRQVVPDRISVIAPDPALGPAIAAMNARAARNAANEEAEWAMRQRSLLAAQANDAYTGMDYAAPVYYYPMYSPYGYGAARRLLHVAQHRPHVSHRHVSHRNVSQRGTAQRGAARAARGSLR